MREYDEDDFLMLSGIQHFIFCKRQWALIHLENQWQESYLTVSGDIMHNRTHNGTLFEKRKDILISRGMPVCSHELGISGICDVVEFHASEDGVEIMGQRGRYSIFPVEYKRGKEKEDESDVMQVVVQALCLEEMFCCRIETGYIFYGETKRRITLEISDEARHKASEIISEMHNFMQRGHTPKVKPSKKCKACSLEEVCLPQISSKKSVERYIDNMLEVD